MQREVVLDASAILAILKRERGAAKALTVLDGAIVSAVNIAEVHSKLIGNGFNDRDSREWIAFLGCTVVPFDERQAYGTGALIPVTRPFGLSLGDRACLALALDRKVPAYTADRNWASLSLGIEIEVIR